MPQRMSALDATFLAKESPTTPMHVGTLSVFDRPEGGFDHERLVRLIRSRLAYVPRYRKRVKQVPLGIARPVWIDDTAFDVTYHVRRAALPQPGSREQLEELVARIMSRPLDLDRPLWEMTLVEGLAEGRFAIVAKSHEALVDGLAALDIAQAILDASADAEAGSIDAWSAQREPSGAELLSEAVTQLATSPTIAAAAARDAAVGLASVVGDTAGAIGTRLREAGASVLRRAPQEAPSPLAVAVGRQRRFASVDLPLEPIREIRTAHGGSVLDVSLAIVAGALRGWLVRRAGADAQVAAVTSPLRALVPVSTGLPSSPQASVEAVLVDLPVGVADPLARLTAISAQTAGMRASDRTVGAGSLLGIAGFAPPTLHALGARLAAGEHPADLTVTNVPGPQEPRFAAGARLLASYPVMPLGPRTALAIGMTSYDGTLCVGVQSDRDAVRDLDALAAALPAALVDLTGTLRRSA